MSAYKLFLCAASTPSVDAGWVAAGAMGYTQCVASCTAALSGPAAPLLAVFGPVVAPGVAAACAAACAAVVGGVGTMVPGICFSDGTPVYVQTKDSDSWVSTPIEQVAAGAHILTYHEGAWAPTRVLNNDRRESDSKMVEISLDSGCAEPFRLTVTEDHLMLLPNIGEDSAVRLTTDEERLSDTKLVTAKDVQVGDKLPVPGSTSFTEGSLELNPTLTQSSLTWAKVIGVNGRKGEFRNELVTECGTVLAGNVVTTTACGGAKQIGERSLII